MSLVTARVRLAGIVGLALVVASAAAAPLHHQLKPAEGVKAVLYVLPAALVPALLVRYALARRWLLVFALSCLVFGATGVLGLAGGLLPSKSAGIKPTVHSKKNLDTSGAGVRKLLHDKGGQAHTHVHLSGGFVVGLLLLLALAVVVSIVIALRRQPPAAPTAPIRKLKPPEPEEVKRRFYSLVQDSLDDLRAEPDPRRAVIAAYARMEQGLGSLGTERIMSETPFEYLARVLERLDVSEAAAQRLTDLFERAKFSAAPVDETMKADAVAALVAIQEEARKWAA
jgi:hypothetical protein